MIEQQLVNEFVTSARNGNINSVITVLANNPGIINKTCQQHRSTALIAACSGQRQDIATMLIKSGADVNSRNKHGYSAIRWSIQKKLNIATNLLLITGAVLNQNEKSELKQDIKKIIYEEIECSVIFEYVYLALKSGIVLFTPVEIDEIVALPTHNLAVDTILIRSDKNVASRKDSNGTTNLHYAAKKGDLDLAKLLIDMGADANALNNKGETALDIANNTNHDNVTYLLEPITEERAPTFANQFLADMAEL